MRLSRMLCFCLLVLSAGPLFPESKNPADYPLRIHIFNREQTTFYRNRIVDESRGEGRANLYEDGEPRGVDFSFDCAHKVRPSLGLFETYPAKWKKPKQELVVLFPVFGKTDAYYTCNLKTGMKDSVYIRRGPGQLDSVPATEFKDWMVKADYDPEHGKDKPKRVERRSAPAGTAQP